MKKLLLVQCTKYAKRTLMQKNMKTEKLTQNIWPKTHCPIYQLFDTHSHIPMKIRHLCIHVIVWLPSSKIPKSTHICIRIIVNTTLGTKVYTNIFVQVHWQFTSEPLLVKVNPEYQQVVDLACVQWNAHLEEYISKCSEEWMYMCICMYICMYLYANKNKSTLTPPTTFVAPIYEYTYMYAQTYSHTRCVHMSVCVYLCLLIMIWQYFSLWFCVYRTLDKSNVKGTPSGKDTNRSFLQRHAVARHP